MWIARDKDGDLFMYSLKPIKGDKHFVCNKFNNECMQIDSELAPEVTWENSPVEVEIRPVRGDNYE